LIRAILLLQTSQVLGRGLYLLFSLWYINRVFGVEAKGTWGSLMALLGILGACSNLGFEVWLTRAVAAKKIGRARALRFLFRAKGILWSICLIIGAVYVVEVGYDHLLALPFAFALVFDGVGVAEQAVFEGRERPGSIAWMSFLKSGGFVILAIPIALFWQPENLVPYTWLFALTLLIRAIWGWRAWRLVPEQGAQEDPRAWHEFAVMGSFTLVTIVYFKIDVLMLTAMIDKAEAGLYDNAYNFVEGALFLSAAVGTILYPKLISGRGEAKARLFDNVFAVVLAMGITGTFGIWLLGERVGSLLIGGARFEGSVVPLMILGMALPIMFTNGLLNRWLFSFHRERFALITATIAMVFNLIGNALLIPRMGASGAALTTVATEGLLFAVWIVWGRRSMRMVGWLTVLAVVLTVFGWLHFGSEASELVSWIGLLGFGALFAIGLHRFRNAERSR